MLELLRSHPGVVKIQQFNRREEARTGADWAWWFEGLGWLGMRVQAKRLEASSRRYEHLLYLSGKKRTRQVDLLRSAAKKDGLYPIYCFYNYWDTTAHPVATVPFHCQSFGPSEQVLGCTLAAADDVHSIVEAGKDDLSSVLDVSFPWVCLVCCPGTESARGLADRVRGALEMHRSDAPVRGEGSRRGRRRAAPTLVERPPTYVTETLEDQRTAEPPTGLAGVVVFRDGARRSTTGR